MVTEYLVVINEPDGNLRPVRDVPGSQTRVTFPLQDPRIGYSFSVLGIDAFGRRGDQRQPVTPPVLFEEREQRLGVAARELQHVRGVDSGHRDRAGYFRLCAASGGEGRWRPEVVAVRHGVVELFRVVRAAGLVAVDAALVLHVVP